MSKLLHSIDVPLMPHGYAGAWAVRSGMRAPPTPVWIDPEDPGPLPAPTEGQVYLWAGRAAPGVSPETLGTAAGLDGAERTALSALKRKENAEAYAAAHGALRLILARVLQRPASDMRYVTGPAGKPALCPETHEDALGLHFNIAHSGELAAVAFAVFPVGIDVELMRWHDDLMGVARNSFAPEHVADLEGRAGDARTALFFRQWTLGEALIKATGMGLGQRIDGFAFTPTGLPPRLVHLEPASGRPDEWHFGVI